MSKSTDSIANTFIVATVLCVVCSVLVSSVTVFLREVQGENKERDRQKNVLVAAGLYDEASGDPATIPEQFSRFEARVVEFATGDFYTGEDIDPATFDQKAAAKDPARGTLVARDVDIAGIKRQSKYAVVYLLRGAGGAVEQVVLPVHGYGLWSTLYGFLALGPDLNTIRGLTFYEHKETPGLGGEVDNPSWKAKWRTSKKAFCDDDLEKVCIEVVKGAAASADPHAVDGLSGATITTRGVSNLLAYWLGEHGFGPFLSKLRAGAATSEN